MQDPIWKEGYLLAFKKYITRQGDTFDIIALDYYNDEFESSRIASANPQYAGVIVFDAGIALNIPIIAKSAVSQLPPWKR